MRSPLLDDYWTVDKGLDPVEEAAALTVLGSYRQRGIFRRGEPAPAEQDAAVRRLSAALWEYRFLRTQMGPGQPEARENVKARLEQLRGHLLELQTACAGIEAVLGDEAHSALPISALRVLELSYRARHGQASFKPDDYLPAPDPLWWRGFEQRDRIRTDAHWVKQVLPVLEGAVSVLEQPGAWAGTAERVFAGRSLALWLELDRPQGELTRRPPRRALADWLELLFRWARIDTTNDFSVMAKRLRESVAEEKD